MYRGGVFSDNVEPQHLPGETVIALQTCLIGTSSYSIVVKRPPRRNVSLSIVVNLEVNTP